MSHPDSPPPPMAPDRRVEIGNLFRATSSPTVPCTADARIIIERGHERELLVARESSRAARQHASYVSPCRRVAGLSAVRASRSA